MKYKTKKLNMQNNELIVKEEGVAYMADSRWMPNKYLTMDSYSEYIEKALDEADKEAENPNTRYYEYADVIKEMRGIINDFKI